MLTVRDALGQFLAASTPLDEGGYIDAAHPRARAMADLAEALSAAIKGHGATLKVQGSVGKGSAAKVPWVAILDSRVATSTQDGVYVVYLVREDFGGVYATLNQGVTRLRKTKGALAARDILTERATALRQQCQGLKSRGFALDNAVDLATDSPLGAEYQLSTIAHRFYAANALPANEDLQADLVAMLAAYDAMVTVSTPEETSEDASARIMQILRVLSRVRTARPTSEGSVAKERKSASKAVASDLGVDERSVADKCGRGLGLASIEDFDRRTSAWLLRGDTGLRELLLQRVSATNGESDRAAVEAFFGEPGANAVPAIPPSVPMTPLREAVPAIHAALEAAGWVYEPWQIAAYITALRTKPFIILGGVSGTGKSELPGLINEIVGGAPRTRISVRPDWTDSSDLLGYRDLKREFRPGDLALAAQAASEDSTRFHVCVIDEMNIARVEHYFAEVLSAIEDRGAAEGGSGTLLNAHLAEDDPAWANLRIPRNLALVGTVNMDESTFGFSKKVLDRAFTIELSSVDLGRWRRGASGTLGSVPMDIADLTRARRRLSDLSAEPESVGKRIDDIIRNLGEVNTILTPAQLHLGYRSRDEIVLFVLNAEEVSDAFRSADGTPVDPLDLALMMKVLPRIAGGSRTVRASLAQLLCWACSRAERASSEEAATTIRDEWVAADRPPVFAGKRYPRSAARLCLMWDRMAEEGFTSFWV